MTQTEPKEPEAVSQPLTDIIAGVVAFYENHPGYTAGAATIIDIYRTLGLLAEEVAALKAREQQ